jgi:hypothetical protein
MRKPRTSAARVLFVVMLCALLGCSDDDNGTSDGGTSLDGALQDGTVSDGPQAGDTQQPGNDAQPKNDGGGTLPPDLKAWCVGNTPKFRIGTQDQANWTGMDAPGSMTGKVLTIEPQFKVGGVKHSFYLTVPYTKTSVSALKVDLASLQPGASVKKNGASGPDVPAGKRKGVVEIVAGGGGFVLKVCAWVDGESWYFPGMPMG